MSDSSTPTATSTITTTPNVEIVAFRNRVVSIEKIDANSTDIHLKGVNVSVNSTPEVEIWCTIRYGCQGSKMGLENQASESSLCLTIN